MVNYVSTYIKGTLNKRSAKDLSNDAYAMFLWVCFSEFLYKSICCGYSFELHWQIDAIQMGTHNICFYKEVDKKYTGVNLKTMELLDCTRIGVCTVIRSNMVCALKMFQIFAWGKYSMPSHHKHLLINRHWAKCVCMHVCMDVCRCLCGKLNKTDLKEGAWVL